MRIGLTTNDRMAAFWNAGTTCVLALLLAVAALLAPFELALAAEPAARLSAHGLKMAGNAERVRVVLEFDREPDVKWYLLRAPHRLVVDMPETAFAIDPDDLAPRGLVAGFRYGNLDAGRSRIILEANGPFEVERLDILKNETSPGHRIVADIAAASEERFEALLADQAETTGSTPKADRLGAATSPAGKPFTIVVDAGHGGIDGGAEGSNGTVEKDVTLVFARELRDALEGQGGYRVHMTRDDDSFLRLDERVRIARQHGADLFISIHADTIRFKDMRGATVYTISEKASDAVAAEAADRENLSDSFAGIEIGEENPQVADILADLIRRETHGFSVGFARTLVGELTDRIELIKNPHRSAGFRVLRAPDIPSVLVELGYLSNPLDEAQFGNADWRRKAAAGIVSAVSAYAGSRRGAGG